MRKKAEQDSSVLKAIYSGKMFPSAYAVLHSVEHDEAVQLRETIRDKLESGFTEQQKEQLQEFVYAMEDTHRLELQYMFGEGVKFGVRVMLETLDGPEGVER